MTGDILEIGVGVGENLPFYQRAANLIAIEPEFSRAQLAHRLAPLIDATATVQVAAAERLPYPTDTFDHIVSSLVFCSVADQRLALREIGRVLKRGGELHMVEHVRPDNRLIAAVFGAVTPCWRQIAYNCHLDRPTLDVLRELGWCVKVYRRRAIFVRLKARRLS